jgi:hypothetical protein
MRVRAYYNKHIIPSYAEQVDDSIRYASDDLYILVKDITKTKQALEIIKGLKEAEVKMVVQLENDKFQNTPIDIEPKDRMYIFGKPYIVDSVQEVIENDRLANKVAKNPRLYYRYTTKVIVLK